MEIDILSVRHILQSRITMNNKNLTLRQKFISLNLRHKLVLLVFFCSIVPLSIMGGVTFFMMKAQMEQSLSNLLEETGQSTARLMDNYLLQRRVDLGLVASWLQYIASRQ